MALGLIDALWSAFGIYITIILYLFSIVVIITIIFVQKKRPLAVLVWVLATLSFPLVFVLLFYVFLGRDHSRKKMFGNKAEMDREVVNALFKTKADLFVSDLSKPGLGPGESLARMLFASNRSYLTSDNEVEYFNEGDKIFKAMLEEIKEAKRFVHVEFYMIRNDAIAKEFRDALVQKAKDGVEVKVIMDSAGCQKLPRNFFKDLTDAGGRTVRFFPSLIPKLHLSINNRNHRKLMVVDGDTAFIGGCNIGVEYRGEGPLGYWRDDMVRIRGSGAISVEKRMIMDWNFAAEDHLKVEDYAPIRPGIGKASLQVVSGGPDTVARHIEEQYVKMITAARSYVYIQTPYFVPSEAVTAALVAAAKSGVDVRVMMPSKPDHPFIYWASLYSAGDMLRSNVRIFQFMKEGFIHAKVVVMDDSVASIGSANFDNRSLGLNFESNAVVYDSELAKKVKAAYIEDVDRRCTELTQEDYSKRSWMVKLREDTSRLYGPIA